MHAKRIPSPKPTEQESTPTQRRISYGWLIAGILLLLIAGNRQVNDLAKSYSVDQITVADAMMTAIDESAKKGQWENALKEYETASKAIRSLGTSASLQALTKLHEQPTLAELEQH